MSEATRAENVAPKPYDLEAHYQELEQKITAAGIPADLGRVRAAFECADRAHSGQKRRDGSPYVSHCIAAAIITAEMGLDEDSIIAALLHDTIEDTSLTHEDIARSFGTSVADIVEGVTKLTRVQYTSVEEQQMEMQQMIDSRPFIEEKIVKQQSELKELSKGYYDLMENQQVDELVTGIILKHNLFPVNLSISETTPGIPMSYILASAKASETHVLTAEEELNGETEVETDGDGTDSGFYAAPQFDYTNTTMVSVTVQGSESEIKSFLDDLARNYPGIQARSFELSNTIYVSENLKSVQSMNCRCDLAVYTCGEIGGESLIEDES